MTDPAASSLTRRTLLRRAGAATLLAGPLPALLAACGGGDTPLGPHASAVAGRAIGIDYASFYLPIEDVQRLVLARARTRGARVTFSSDASGSSAQLANLTDWTGERGGFRVLVIAPFDASAVDPLAARAISGGIDVVSYGVPLSHQTAAVATDAAASGQALARDAASFVTGTLGGAGRALIVRPPTDSQAPDQFAARAAPSERALRAELAQRAPGLKIAGTATAQSSADAETAVQAALLQFPSVSVVLCWNDTTAVGAARALRSAHPRSAWPRLYAGGQGAPAIASAATITALRDDPALRCIVAPRLRDIANALVDVPYSLLRNAQPHDVNPPLAALTPRSPQLAAFASDYANGS
ncbi:MAG TPA: substrate-binding domain-containing protein [Conexibacter sp.]|jgi:ABC-type sugar transport system substrate-binding protein